MIHIITGVFPFLAQYRHAFFIYCKVSIIRTVLIRNVLRQIGIVCSHRPALFRIHVNSIVTGRETVNGHLTALQARRHRHYLILVASNVYIQIPTEFPCQDRSGAQQQLNTLIAHFTKVGDHSVIA